MKVKILTLADQEGQRYRVCVFVDGTFRYSLPTTLGNVVKVRNAEAERLCEIATEVIAAAIPRIY
jgi:hypothetical protein